MTEQSPSLSATAVAGRNEGTLQLIVVVSCFFGLMAGFTSTYFYTSGLFLIPVSNDLGLSRSQASLGPLICTLGSAAITPFFGRLLDRVGPVRVALLSLFGLAVGFFSMAFFSASFATYLLCSLLIALLGSGSTSLSFSRIVLDAFVKRRGLALGFMLTGTGAGALLLPPLMMPIIQHSGWRTAYMYLGAYVSGAALLFSLLILPLGSWLRAAASLARKQAAPVVSRAMNTAVWTDSRFILIGGMFFALGLSGLSLLVHFVPLLIGEGVPAARAATIAGSIGLASIGGRLIMGYLLDRFAPERLTLGVIALIAVCALLLIFDARQTALLSAIGIGLVMGAESDLMSFFMIRYFAPSEYGSAYGGVFAVYLIGGAVGPAVTSLLFDLSGGYFIPLCAALVCLVVAAVVVVNLRPAAEAKGAAH